MSDEILAPTFQTYTAREVASLTGFPLTTVYQAVRDGSLRAMRPNGTSRGARVRPEAIREWMRGMEE